MGFGPEYVLPSFNVSFYSLKVKNKYSNSSSNIKAVLSIRKGANEPGFTKETVLYHCFASRFSCAFLKKLIPTSRLRLMLQRIRAPFMSAKLSCLVVRAQVKGSREVIVRHSHAGVANGVVFIFTLRYLHFHCGGRDSKRLRISSYESKNRFRY